MLQVEQPEVAASAIGPRPEHVFVWSAAHDEVHWRVAPLAGPPLFYALDHVAPNEAVEKVPSRNRPCVPAEIGFSGSPTIDDREDRGQRR